VLLIYREFSEGKLTKILRHELTSSKSW